MAMRAGSLFALAYKSTGYGSPSGPMVLSLSLTDGRMQRLVPMQSFSLYIDAQRLDSVPAGLLVSALSSSGQWRWGLALLDATSLEQRWEWVQGSPGMAGIAPLIAADGASVAVAATCYARSAAWTCSGASASVVNLASGAETPVLFSTQYAKPVAMAPQGKSGFVWAMGTAYLPNVTSGVARSAEAEVVWQTRTDGMLLYLGAPANSSSSLVFLIDTLASALVAATASEAGPAPGGSSTRATLSAGAQAGIALAVVAACGAALAAALHFRKLRARLFFRELPEGTAKGSSEELSAVNGGSANQGAV